MLSVPTLWTVFVINFLALGLIWAYVMRSYPSFEAARFWTGSAFVAAAGAAMAMLRVVFPDSLVPLLFAGTALILAICLAAMGIRKFFNQPVSWRDTLLITGLGAAGLCVFTFVHDSVPARMTVFTIAQALPMVLQPETAADRGMRAASIRAPGWPASSPFSSSAIFAPGCSAR